jgi:hypothetical protein
MSILEEKYPFIVSLYETLLPDEVLRKESSLYLDISFIRICVLAKEQDKEDLITLSKEVLSNWLKYKKSEDNVDLVILLNMMIFAGDPTQVDQESMMELQKFYSN